MLNASKMPKEKLDELLSIKDKNIQIDLLAKFYAKQTSQVQKNKLIDESKIFALNTLALQNMSQKDG
ncbi:hypothetical protein [Campylobacter upsaliensis]|uniref:hypothetical protein n=2 Tax=Campylobacter upsaliensis TaxID=28080 RepID=UPI002B413487|nr:hypothetical protein [Campylobacter upsaliensis]